MHLPKLPTSINCSNVNNTIDYLSNHIATVLQTG